MDDNTIKVTKDTEETPDRGFNKESVFWKAEDYNEFDFGKGHVHTSSPDQPIELSDIKIDDIPVPELDIMDEILWEEVVSVLVAHFSEGWEVFVLIGKDKDGPFKVVVPTFIFQDENVPEQMRVEFAKMLKMLHENGQVGVIEDNMKTIFDWAE